MNISKSQYRYLTVFFLVVISGCTVSEKDITHEVRVDSLVSSEATSPAQVAIPETTSVFESENFNLSYPQDWEVDSQNTQEDILLFDSSENPYPASISILLQPNSEDSIQDLYEFIDQLLSGSYKDFYLLNKEIQTIDDLDTLLVETTYTDGDVLVHSYELFVDGVHNDYIISGSSSENEWEHYKGELLNSLNSFEEK